MDWFLYDNCFRHERVKHLSLSTQVMIDYFFNMIYMYCIKIITSRNWCVRSDVLLKITASLGFVGLFNDSVIKWGILLIALPIKLDLFFLLFSQLSLFWFNIRGLILNEYSFLGTTFAIIGSMNFLRMFTSINPP